MSHIFKRTFVIAFFLLWANIEFGEGKSIYIFCSIQIYNLESEMSSICHYSFIYLFLISNQANASIQTPILQIMKVIHVSGTMKTMTKMTKIIVVITIPTILKQTKCAVFVEEETIPLVNIAKMINKNKMPAQYVFTQI